MISPEIIKIASDTSNSGIDENANSVATSKNKNCGDIITIAIKIKNNKIERMSYETKSCIFCQASASLLSRSIKDKNIKINTLSSILATTMKHKNFKKLLKIKERINCIMLPFETLQKAMNNTQ